jgi:predicted nucleic acid-binding protein
MKEYVLDANAVLRYFAMSAGGGADKVRGLFEQAEKKQARLSMSAINLGEVLYILLKRVDEDRAMHYIQALQHAVTVVDADLTMTVQAAKLKHRYKLGYADSFAAALALECNATLVSADPAFEKAGKALKWLRLPKFEPKQR